MMKETGDEDKTLWAYELADGILDGLGLEQFAWLSALKEDIADHLILEREAAYKQGLERGALIAEESWSGSAKEIVNKIREEASRE